MTSRAIDLVTIARALQHLDDEGIVGADWRAKTHGSKDDRQIQEFFVKWWKRHGKEIRKIAGIKALAAKTPEPLNKLLTDDGFNPFFGPMGPDDLGVVSILDMMVEWLHECSVTTVEMSGFDSHATSAKAAFRVPTESCNIYRIEDDHESTTYPLVEIITKTGDSLWLCKTTDEDPDEIEIFADMDRLLAGKRTRIGTYDGIVVPMVDLSVRPDLSWLLGMHSGEWAISSTEQQLKLRMNEQGARAKVATSMVMTRGATRNPRPYLFDEPFNGCFTQKGLPHLPLAAFQIDVDACKRPTGSLADM